VKNRHSEEIMSSHILAATPNANFEIKETLATYDTVAFPSETNGSRPTPADNVCDRMGYG
jgi:hypothetical protein